MLIFLYVNFVPHWLDMKIVFFIYEKMFKVLNKFGSNDAMLVLCTIKYYGALHHKSAKPVIHTMNPHSHLCYACVCVAVGCVVL